MKNKFKRVGKYYVYILECKDGTYYTGYTNDLEKRIREHNNTKRGAKYLRGKLPAILVYTKEYVYFKRAVSAERKIKSFSRKRKEELIRIYGRENRKK